jgi:hypothetical protein
MHILLSILGAIITILILLKRLEAGGIDIGWLNPFAWKRRRAWAKKYHANPMYALDNPRDVAALLVVALAKSEGDMSAEQKKHILSRFTETFHLPQTEAEDLMVSSNYLLREGIDGVNNINKLMAASASRFTPAHAQSALALCNEIATLESPANAWQQNLLHRLTQYFDQQFGDKS